MARPTQHEELWNRFSYGTVTGGSSGGTANFNELENRPKVDGTAMNGSTNITSISLEEIDELF